MYVHLGQNVIVKKRDIVGVFDMDTSTICKSTREYLTGAQERGRVINVSAYDLPKSFVICGEKGDYKIFISPLAPKTIAKRSETF